MGDNILLLHAVRLCIQLTGELAGLCELDTDSLLQCQMFEEFFTLVRSLKALILLVLAPSQAERLSDFRDELEEEVLLKLNQVAT